MVEEWKQISYASSYEISNFGNVKNIKTNKLLNLNYERCKKTNTRMRVGLSEKGKLKSYYLHRIVAQHFIENPGDLPEVNHINGDFYNNKASNLEWISKINNMKHARDNNLVTNYKRKVLVKNKISQEEITFDSVSECSDYFNCSIGTISQICNNKYKCKDNKEGIIKKPSRQVIQYNKNNEIINIFNSVIEAKNKLNINNISSCCNYYKYDDLTRPKSYKCSSIKNFIFKFGEITNRPNTSDKFINFEISYLTSEQNDTKYQKNNEENNEENIIWKEYPNLKKYMVSNTGEVKHKRTNRILQGSKVNGYRFVNLHRDNKTKKNCLIHRIVAETFLKNPENKPVVNHKDTNILNNHVDNLEWVTYKENMNTNKTKENLKKGKNSKNILQVDIDSGKVINRFYGASECKEKTNINSNTILNICNYYRGNKCYGGRGNNQKTYQKKYIFIFEEDETNIKKYLKIAKTVPKNHAKKVNQYEKNSNKLLQTFKSCYDASNILNIGLSGINLCCQYYKYTDENRPKCYKLKSFKGFVFKQEDNVP